MWKLLFILICFFSLQEGMGKEKTQVFVPNSEQKLTPQTAQPIEETNTPTQALEKMPEPSAVPISYSKTLLKMLLSLAALLVLLFITFWSFRKILRTRMFSRNPEKSIKILERKPLSQKSILYLIEVEKEKVLVVESQLEVRKLHVIPNLDEPSQ